MTSLHDSAYELCAGQPDATVFLTCEHASERVPAAWTLPECDVHLLGTHWAYDLGAAELAHELAEALDAPAVLSRFTRLLVDPNRPETSPELFRKTADGHIIELNRHVDPADRERRLRDCHHPYHQAIDRNLTRSNAEIVLGVHTFTPLYEGQPRHMEIGVLFDREEDLAERTAAVLRDAGMIVAMNQPWSGKDGLIYSVERHADAHGRRALELEVRQDLATEPGFRKKLVRALKTLF